MRRAEGNLTTGTYISICNADSDESVAKVEAKGNDYQVLGIKNRNDENSEVRTISTPTGVFHSYSLVAYRESGE